MWRTLFIRNEEIIPQTQHQQETSIQHQLKQICHAFPNQIFPNEILYNHIVGFLGF